MNTSNGMMAPSSSSGTVQSPGLKTYFKTLEGRYKLQYEKTHPSGLLHYAHGKTVTQVCCKPDLILFAMMLDARVAIACGFFVLGL